MNTEAITAGREAGTFPASSSVRDYFTLLKPGVMTLVVFTGAVGMLLAPGDIHPFLGLLTVLCIALGSGAGGAINMWFDRDIDAGMMRTLTRPVPSGRVSPEDALSFGIILAIASVSLMGLAVGWMPALLLAGAIAFYVFIYTMWLKRRTPQNIVIGGAAGAFPPMIGWAAVANEISLESTILFLIIFMWTPPHFWSLALYRCGDYAKVGVPMLPVVGGIRQTKQQILLYTLALSVTAMLPLFLGQAGWVYGAVAAGLNVWFLWYAVRVWFDETDRSAKRMFLFSISYLFLLFGGLLLDHLLLAT